MVLKIFKQPPTDTSKEKKEKKKASHQAGEGSKARRNGINESMWAASVYAVVPCFMLCVGCVRQTIFAESFLFDYY